MVERFSGQRVVGFTVVVAIVAIGIWYGLGGSPTPLGPTTDGPTTDGPPTNGPPTTGPTSDRQPSGASGAGAATSVRPDSIAQTPPEKIVPLPQVRISRFQNIASNATYLGGESCIACHDDEHQSYLQTAHSRSLNQVDPAQAPPDGKLDDPVSGRSYEIFRESDQLRHRETMKTGADQELELANHALRYVVGSGVHAHTYLVETAAGFLAESPVSWYASKKHWALSPGFENYNTGFARPVYAECLFCHSGRVESIGGNRSRVAVHALAIDCERCHGPGSLHVAAQKSGDAPASDIDLTIVNPAHLSRTQNEAIRAQCHLDSIADADVRGRNLRDFQPGQWLEDYRVHFALQVPNTEMKVVGHVEQLHLSNCYRGSETLTCTTCHPSHDASVTADRVSFYRGKCLECHTDQPCGLPPKERLSQSSTDDCVACHMPPSKTDVLHVAATHHRIGIHGDEPPAARPAAVGTLIPLGDISHLPKLEQDRCLGLGYLDLSLGERNPQLSNTYRERARDILEDVKQRGLADPVMATALARIYQRENPPKSLQYAEAALQSVDLQADTRTQALFALSNAYLGMDQTALAIQPLEELTLLRRQAGDWFLLGVCRYQGGKLDEALTAALRAAEIRPDSPKFQALLAELYRQLGQNELADQHEQRARQLAGPPAAAP